MRAAVVSAMALADCRVSLVFAGLENDD